MTCHLVPQVDRVFFRTAYVRGLVAARVYIHATTVVCIQRFASRYCAWVHTSRASARAYAPCLVRRKVTLACNIKYCNAENQPLSGKPRPTRGCHLAPQTNSVERQPESPENPLQSPMGRPICSRRQCLMSTLPLLSHDLPCRQCVAHLRMRSHVGPAVSAMQSPGQTFYAGAPDGGQEPGHMLKSAGFTQSIPVHYHPAGCLGPTAMAVQGAQQ